MSNDTSILVEKSKAATFERGFKTWCENTSLNIRRKLKLSPTDPLSPQQLAQVLNVIVWTTADVPELAPKTREYLDSSIGDEWSAVTVEAAGKTIIVVNKSHSEARQASDIMHELAHIIRGHEAGKVYIIGSHAMRDFNEIQENEANWLAGTLLLPRTVLTACVYRRAPIDEILAKYGVSKQLYTYRVNMAGVRKQFKRS